MTVEYFEVYSLTGELLAGFKYEAQADVFVTVALFGLGEIRRKTKTVPKKEKTK